MLQGLALFDPDTPFQRSVEVVRPTLMIRSLAGIVLTAGHIVFAAHVWRMVRGTSAERALPALHQARPVLVSAPARREPAS